MSRAPVNYKRQALALDPMATSHSKAVGTLTQWIILDGRGETIGYSNPATERNSRTAWMRAYYELGRRAAIANTAAAIRRLR